MKPSFVYAMLVSGIAMRFRPPREGEAAFLRAEALTGKVQRHQGGGARRIHREARAAEIEKIGEAIGDDAVRPACIRLRLHPADIRELEEVVVDALALDAEEDARLGPADDFDRNPPRPRGSSHATSSAMRCWGSMRTASLGEMPKNDGSNSDASGTNPPQRMLRRSGAHRAGSAKLSLFQRSCGTGVMASRPATRFSQKASGVRRAPGESAAHAGRWRWHPAARSPLHRRLPTRRRFTPAAVRAAVEHCVEMTDEPLEAGIIVDRHGRKAHAEAELEPAAQLDGGERGDAEIEEALSHITFGNRHAQDRGKLLARVRLQDSSRCALETAPRSERRSPSDAASVLEDSRVTREPMVPVGPAISAVSRVVSLIVNASSSAARTAREADWSHEGRSCRTGRLRDNKARGAQGRAQDGLDPCEAAISPVRVPAHAPLLPLGQMF